MNTKVERIEAHVSLPQLNNKKYYCFANLVSSLWSLHPFSGFVFAGTSESKSQVSPNLTSKYFSMSL